MSSFRTALRRALRRLFRLPATLFLLGQLSLAIGIVLSLLASVGPPTPVRAAEVPGGPQTWDKRLQIVVKSVYVSDDHDWGGVGEMRLNARLYRMAPGCAPGSSHAGCQEGLAVAPRIPFRANDGNNVTLNRRLPTAGSDDFVVDASISPEIGFPVWDDRIYGLELTLLEEDFGADGQLGDATLMLSRGLGWFVGTNVMRGMKNGGTEPGDFSAEVEIREAELPDLRPVDILVRDIPGSSDRLVCAAVQNPGLIDIGAFEMTLRLNGTGLPNGRIAGGSLSRGDAKEVCLQTALPTSGPHTLAAIADERGLMVETSETNNRVEKAYVARPSGGLQGPGQEPDEQTAVDTDTSPDAPPATVPSLNTPSRPSRADLTVGSIRVNGQVPDGKDDCKDGKNAVTVVVKNAGGTKAGPFAVHLAVDGDEAVEELLDGLEAGQDREVRFGDVKLKKGAHQLAATVDPDKAVAESGEENNARTVTTACRD